MTTPDPAFEIFLVAPPGLENALLTEVLNKGFPSPQITPGGVVFQGQWSDVWRANVTLRGATRVLARIGSFRAFHLAQLDKRARKFPWGDVLRPDVPLRVEVTTRKSKIYHAGAASQRIETALKESLGATISAEAPLTLKVRIDDNLVTFSVDTSGPSLHKRGFKEAVNKAPMRETLAALFLTECGYTGNEPVLDPMCGSGTFVIEAAEIAAGLEPGRAREFVFEHLATFDPAALAALRNRPSSNGITPHFHGSDRDSGAVRMATVNAARAGVEAITTFSHSAISDLQRPEGPAGLVIVNPPYGARVSNKKPLFGLYDSFGRVMKERFSGWRVGIITTDAPLARSTGLTFAHETAPIPHGGLKVKLYLTDPLP